MAMMTNQSNIKLLMKIPKIEQLQHGRSIFTRFPVDLPKLQKKRNHKKKILNEWLSAVKERKSFKKSCKKEIRKVSIVNADNTIRIAKRKLLTNVVTVLKLEIFDFRLSVKRLRYTAIDVTIYILIDF